MTTLPPIPNLPTTSSSSSSSSEGGGAKVKNLTPAAANKKRKELLKAARYGSLAQVRCLVLYNKKDPEAEVRRCLGSHLVPEWLFAPLRVVAATGEDGKLTTRLSSDTRLHAGYYKGALHPYAWCPVRHPPGHPELYGIYYTLVNRIDYLERLVQLGGGPRGPCYGALRELQDRYQMLSLHMELKNQYTNAELLERPRKEGAGGAEDPSPAELYWPSEDTAITREELPDLFLHSFYLKFWGDAVDLPWSDPQVLKIVDLLSKALPFPCKSRSVSTILPEDWFGEENTLVFRVVLRIILGGLLGLYEHCRVSANFHARRAVYRSFCLVLPRKHELDQWLHEHKRIITYSVREYIFWMLKDVASLHAYLHEHYYWRNLEESAFDAMDQLRRHFNSVMELSAHAEPVVDCSGGILRQLHLGVAREETEDPSYFTLPGHENVQRVFTAVPSSSPEGGGVKRKRSTLYKPHLVAVATEEANRVRLPSEPKPTVLLPWQPGFSGFEGVDEVLRAANKVNLRYCHRPIEKSFLDKVLFEMNLLDDQSQRKNPQLREAEESFPESLRELMWEVILRQPDESAPFDWLALVFGVSADRTVEPLNHARYLYLQETDRSCVRNVLEAVARDDPYDYAVLRNYFTLLKKRNAFLVYDLPPEITLRQVAEYHRMYGTQMGQPLHKQAGLYFVCTNCGRLKSQVFDSVTKSSKKKKNNSNSPRNVAKQKRYSHYSVGISVHLMQRRLHCSKKANRNYPKKRAKTDAASDGEATDDEDEVGAEEEEEGGVDMLLLGDVAERLAETAGLSEPGTAAAAASPSVVVKEHRKRTKDERKRNVMQQCPHTELTPFNVIGKYWRTEQGLAMACPECVCLTAFTRYHYERSGGRLNCGCLREAAEMRAAAATASSSKKGQQHREDEKVACALCGVGCKGGARYKLFYDDEERVAPGKRVRPVPLCETHSEHWQNLHTLPRLSQVRKAMLEGQMSVRVGNTGERIFVASPSEGGGTGATRAAAAERQLRKSFSALSKRRSSILQPREESQLAEQASAAKAPRAAAKKKQKKSTSFYPPSLLSPSPSPSAVEG
jgi:hypothetical protein